MPPEDGTTTAYLQPLVARLNAGDRAAADALLAYSMDRLRGFAARLLARDGMARWYEPDDLYQRTAHDLITMLRDQPPATAREFLRIAAWKMRHCLRDLAREVRKGRGGLASQHETDHPAPGRSGDGPRVAEAADDGHDPAAAAELLDVHEVADRLPDDERDVVDLLFYNHLTQEEAAEALGVSVPTVKRRWREARERMAEMLAR
jgi:RNA polymerase sigma-70 factor (ECF subfamily)